MDEQGKKGVTESSGLQDSKTEKPKEQESTTNTESEKVSLTKAELDKLIGEKVFKATQKKEKELQERLAKESGNWEDAYKQVQKELEELKQENAKVQHNDFVMKEASKNGLTDYVDILSELPDTEAVKKAVAKLKSTIEGTVEKRLSERLNSVSPSKSTFSIDKTIQDIADSGNLEEWKEYKKKHGLSR